MTWVIDTNFSGFFASINLRVLIALIRERGNDGALIRLVGQ